jgi:hypothetical protein
MSRVVMDRDGDGKVDMAILLTGNHAEYDNFGF